MLLWHLRADTSWLSEFTRDGLSCKHHGLDKELITLRRGKFSQKDSKLSIEVKSPCLVTTFAASTGLQFFSLKRQSRDTAVLRRWNDMTWKHLSERLLPC